MLQYPYPIRLTSIWEKTMRQFSERFSSCRTQQKYTQVGTKIFRFFRIDNSCKQKAQLRLMKIEIARCNLAGGERSFVRVVWPQFDHKRNETSWHPMKQNGIMHLKFNDAESRQYRIVHCVLNRSTMGFKRPWVRFSPLGPNKNNPNLFPIGDGFGLFVFFGKLAFAKQWKPQWGF